MGAVCFDTRFHVIAREPSNRSMNDFNIFQTSRIAGFIAEKFARIPDGKNIFYTFLWHESLASNIVLLEKDGRYMGVLISQAVFIKQLDPSEKEQIIDLTGSSKNSRKELRDYYEKIPVFSPERVTAAGEIITSLIAYIMKNDPAAQTADNITGVCLADSPERNSEEPAEQVMAATGMREPVRIEYVNYLRLKEYIQHGNAEIADETLLDINLFPDEPAGLSETALMRSIKNRGIGICAMASCIAIEANVPYQKVFILSGETIRQIEKAESPAKVTELIRKVLLDITRAAEAGRMQSYSKPVRQVLEYIREHYAEKITLALLAEHTGLSTFYLSTLIKKETGLSLTGHINMTRVEESKKMLLNKNTNIIEVADRVGFLYQNHFSTVFKKITGMTPTEYIKSAENPGLSNDALHLAGSTDSFEGTPDQRFPVV